MDDAIAKYAITTVHYLSETLTNRSQEETPDRIGHLLPLTCGHNKNHSDEEKARLLHHLRQRGWTRS